MSESDQPSLERCAYQLSQSLSESRKAYEQWLQLELQEKELVAQEDIDGIAEKISEIQDLLAVVQSIDTKLHDEHTNWQAVRDQAPVGLREHLQQQVDSLQAVIAEILELHKENEDKIREYSTQINQKLQDLQKRRTAHRGYQQRSAKDAYERSRFYDKNS
jgi:SOS response regulatory protein OraA/RecX